MDIDRNLTAIIGDGYRVVFINNNIDSVAIPAHGLVNGVIHDLVDQMVQPRARRYHRYTSPDAGVPPRSPPRPGCSSRHNYALAAKPSLLFRNVVLRRGFA